MVARRLLDAVKRRPTTLLLCFIGAMILSLVACVGLGEPETSQESSIPGLAQAIAEIFPDKETTLTSTDKKVYVYVPSQAVAEGGNLMITVKEPNIFPEADGKWYRPIVVNLDIYDESGKFVPNPEITQPIDVCFALSDEGWNEYQVFTDDFNIQYYDFLTGTWLPISAATHADTKQLCAKVDVLTLYALAVKNQLLPVTAPRGVYSP